VDVRLQGQQAAQQITEAIQRLNREKRVSVIVLTRGGGRHEDLAVFNDVAIAQAICASAIPIVTGIGHQRDDTLADQMADFKAITPTAAALELAKHSQPISRSTVARVGHTQLLLIGAGVIIAILMILLILVSFSAN
jgi:exodeoxyribonuclease VII large subunit